jgi:hypothetical protein
MYANFSLAMVHVIEHVICCGHAKMQHLCDTPSVLLRKFLTAAGGHLVFDARLRIKPPTGAGRMRFPTDTAEEVILE